MSRLRVLWKMESPGEGRGGREGERSEGRARGERESGEGRKMERRGKGERNGEEGKEGEKWRGWKGGVENRRKAEMEKEGRNREERRGGMRVNVVVGEIGVTPDV